MKLRADQFKQRANYLREERQGLIKRKEELELQTNEANLPFAEARERLLNRIKQDNAEILQSEKKVTDLSKTVEQYKRNIKEIESDLAEKKSDQNEAQKYEILAQKDKEITEFMENFDDMQKKDVEQIGILERTIAHLLEHMSKNISRQTNLPSQGDVSELKDDLHFKKGLNEQSEQTVARLKVELEQRQGDLEKIKNLDVKISKEMTTVTQKLD